MRFIDRHVNLKGLCLSDLINPQNNPGFYKTETVRKHLVLCYGLKCCYCEATISSTAYFHVDHFYPKSPPKINGQLQYPAQFINNTVVPYANIVNDVRNFHLACARCNILKSDFVGVALSPNFYHDGIQWKETTDRYISANIYYKGAYVYSSTMYALFVQKLNMNGKTPSEKMALHTSSLLDRTRYLEETRMLLHIVYKLCLLNDVNSAKDLFRVVSCRFRRNTQYSTMIVTNLGRAYLTIDSFLKKY